MNSPLNYCANSAQSKFCLGLWYTCITATELCFRCQNYAASLHFTKYPLVYSRWQENLAVFWQSFSEFFHPQSVLCQPIWKCTMSSWYSPSELTATSESLIGTFSINPNLPKNMRKTNRHPDKQQEQSEVIKKDRLMTWKKKVGQKMTLR